jgi:hypothetical protein
VRVSRYNKNRVRSVNIEHGRATRGDLRSTGTIHGRGLFDTTEHRVEVGLGYPKGRRSSGIRRVTGSGQRPDAPVGEFCLAAVTSTYYRRSSVGGRSREFNSGYGCPNTFPIHSSGTRIIVILAFTNFCHCFRYSLIQVKRRTCDENNMN